MAASAIFPSILIGITILAVLRRRQRNSSDVHRLPCPTNSHWLWGHEKEVFDRPQPEPYNAWTDAFGGAYRIDGALWYGSILVATDPEIITHIFTRNLYKYTKSPYFRPLIERLIGRSIVWAEGEEHKRMAKVLAGCFNSERVRKMHGAVVDSAQRLSSLLRSYVLDRTESEPDSGVLMNIIGWPSKATLDIIGRVGFDYDFRCGESPEAKDIARLWNEQCEMGITFAGFIAPILLRAFPILNSLLPLKIKEAQSATKMHIHKPGKWNYPDSNPGRRYLGPPQQRRLNTAALSLDPCLAVGRARDAIDAAGAEFAQTDAYDGPGASKVVGSTASVDMHLMRWKESRNNLLSDLVKASVQDDKEVNVDELLDHISTFVMVGHETSAGVISYTLHALCADQKRQDKLRTELSAAGFCAASGTQGKEPTYDELMDSKTLPYLDAVVKEALRLFTPPASTERVALEDDEIPLKTPVLAADGKTVLNSIRVRKGQMIVISWLSVNSNLRTWGPDSMSFKPERWLVATPDSQNPALPCAVSGGYQHLGTFSEGPRMCLGYRLALLEIKAILLTLVRDFQFDAVNHVPVRNPMTGQPTGEMMDVKIESTFAGLLQPHIKDGEKAGMGGVWLPVRTRPVDP